MYRLLQPRQEARVLPLHELHPMVLAEVPLPGLLVLLVVELGLLPAGGALRGFHGDFVALKA